MYSGVGNYLHYKGGRYTVLGVATNVSNDRGGAEQLVIYTDTRAPGESIAMGCTMYARPLKEFDQEVPTDNLVDNPRGRLPRFRRID